MKWYSWKIWRFAWGAGPRHREDYSGRHVIDSDGLWVWVAKGLFVLIARPG